MRQHKITSVLLATALITASVTSCSQDQERGNATNTLPTAAEVTESEGPAATDTIPSSDPDLPISPTVGPTPAQSEASLVFPDDFIHDDYEIIMDFVDTMHNDPSASYQFTLTESYDMDTASWYWGIWLVNPDGSATEYRCENGAVVESGEAYDYFYGDPIDYDTFSTLPLLYDTHGSTCDVIDSVEDGLYYGSLLGVSLDCTKIVAEFGSPIYLTEDEIRSYNVGDTIHFDELDEDLVIADMGEDYVSFDDEWHYLGRYHAASISSNSIFLLMEASDNPVRYNCHVAVLPIADDCEITDTFPILSGRNTVDPALSQGNPLSESYYWTYTIEDDDPGMIEHCAQLSNNGFVSSWGLLYPILIENGQITLMQIEWR